MSDEDRREAAAPGQGADQRGAARYSLLIRPAKLVVNGREYLCVLRDVSPGGFKVRIFHKLPPQAQMVLELGNGDRYDVERVWERDNDAGFRFLSSIPVEYVLNEEGPFRKRPIRLKMQLPAVIVTGREAAPVVVRDLSQQGARLECAAPLALDQQARLEIDGLSAIIAKVRWRRQGAIGLIFEQTFKLDELARLAVALQPGLPAADQPGDPEALPRYA